MGMGEVKKQKQFPHISRFITALKTKKTLRSIAPVFVAVGILIIALVNITAFSHLPHEVWNLLTNPNDAPSLLSVASKLKSPTAQKSFLTMLRENNQDEIATNALLIQHNRKKKIEEVRTLLVQFPRYPDAHAYIAVLMLQNEQCVDAAHEINIALTLDPNREELQKLSQTIQKQCE